MEERAILFKANLDLNQNDINNNKVPQIEIDD